MFHYRLLSYKAIFLSLITIIIIHRTQQVPLRLDGSNANDLIHDATITSQSNREIGPHQQDETLKSPFIVLMSNNTISVAQLPLIIYGNISEIYRLSDEDTQYTGIEYEQPSEGDTEEGRSAEDPKRRRKQQQENEPNTDFREYEQMPSTTAVNTTMSLGKSEWQQIAGQRDREEVWLPQQTTQTGINRKSARDGDSEDDDREEDDDGRGRRLGRPRKKRRIRRSNSSNDEEDSGSSNNNSGPHQMDSTTSDAQTSRRVNSAKESNEQNVTSAQSDVEQRQQQQQQQQLNLTLDGTRLWVGGAPAEDDDKTSRPSHSSSSRTSSSSAPFPRATSSSSKVRFSDFDVHMALGYAFVADSAGRIHRFRLLSSTQASLPNHGGGIVSHSENFSEKDDANSIDAGGKFEFVSRQSKESGINDSRLNSTTETTTATASNSVQIGPSNHDDSENSQRASEDLNDVNKVGRRTSDVTHEHSGNDRQHPTISGGQSVLAVDSSPASSTSRGGSPISGGSKATNHNQQAKFDEHNFETSGAKPRVIWSRNKYTRARPSVNAGAKASSTKQGESLRQQLADAEGALPDENSNQMVDGQTAIRGAAKKEHQLHHNSGAEGGESQNDHTVDGPSGNDEQQREGLRTEIAVDWLNNLLFVLDKCRLLVMDFDGSNELVLIDDFNVHNRPVDIKVDPINDFLFWLQIGKFHNTIYKLDLSVLSMPSATQKLVSNALRLRQIMGLNGNDNSSGFDASDLVPLVSHHYAHPIITNLPRHTKIFTIDHKHSRIYVPLIPASASTDQSTTSPSLDQSKKDDAEVFASTDDITHLNNTDTESFLIGDNGKNCNHSDVHVHEGQILAYNLDGTDVGPFRTEGEESHISNLDNIQDLALDSESNLLYWLTNDGKDLVEEFKENATIQPAQHYLNGRSYSKLIYFANNDFIQPTATKSRFSVRKIINILSSSISPNRPTRSDGIYQADDDGQALKVRHLDGDTTRFSRNAPAIILGLTCLIVVTIYLIYTLVFQHSMGHQNSNDAQFREESISGGSSIDESQVGTNLNGFINSNTISKWIAGPSVRTRDMSSANGQLGAYDIESTNYDASNAIDEHYRDSTVNGEQSFDASSNRLANLSAWPTNMHDRSNKLYVPVEVLQDEALSSIRRVSIDQLVFEKTAPLGQGHFGTVLQGTIKCTLHEKTSFLDKSHTTVPCNAPISPDSLAPPSRSRAFAVSSTSSGHGSSSSTSCEFTTANSCMGATDDDGYLTPKNQLNSSSSDYCAEVPANSLRDESFIGYCDTTICHSTDASTKVETKLKVAIKKLKDNASLEEKRDFLQEAKLLANFDHPNIVQLIGICLDRGSTLIVMELMLGGDLIRYMQENKPNSMNNFTDNLTYEDLLKVCLDIANGCCYLENLDYIHRDLAARNCLVSSRKREERVVKLADFGLARDICKDSCYQKLNDSAMPLKWMAPECIIERRFTKKSDVWSFGVVMWEVMSYCEEKPYENVLGELMTVHLASGARLRKPEYCDDNMYHLMNQCWQLEPENRPTFHECRNMLYSILKEFEVRKSSEL